MAENEAEQAAMPTQMGGTFAERAGKKAPPAAKVSNSTFAERAKGSKAVQDDDEGAENKAVAKKTAAKKS